MVTSLAIQMEKLKVYLPMDSRRANRWGYRKVNHSVMPKANRLDYQRGFQRGIHLESHLAMQTGTR